MQIFKKKNKINEDATKEELSNLQKMTYDERFTYMVDKLLGRKLVESGIKSIIIESENSMKVYGVIVPKGTDIDYDDLELLNREMNVKGMKPIEHGAMLIQFKS